MVGQLSFMPRSAWPGCTWTCTATIRRRLGDGSSSWATVSLRWSTKPIWTELVSQAALVKERFQSSLTVGTTAYALNQRAMPSSLARDRNPRARH